MNELKEYDGIPYNECQYKTLLKEERKRYCDSCIKLFGYTNCPYLVLHAGIDGYEISSSDREK